MYSKELQELDRNTVQYMIDEMGEEINRQQGQITDLRSEITDLQDTNTDLQEQLERQSQELKVWKLSKRGCSEEKIASETGLDTELIHEILNNS